jgi:hypothetical protein
MYSQFNVFGIFDMLDPLLDLPSLLSIGNQRLFPQGIKWLGHEADLSPLSSAEDKNAWSYT